jgi:hypothetical protein
VALTYSYDLNTLVGQTRGLIGDAPDDAERTLSGTPRSDWPCVLADEEIAFALTRRNNSLYEAASDLLLQIASSQARLTQMIKVGNFWQDNRHLAKDLREQAAALLDQAAQTPAEAIVSPYGTVFQTQEILTRDMMRRLPGWMDTELP